MKNTLINALCAAGDIQLEYFNKVGMVQQKEHIGSIVTEVDLLCDQCIFDILTTDFPSFNFLSEERAYIDMGSAYTWVVDPLDGTSNYAAKLPWFGVLIALFKGNVPIMAGAYLPVSEQLYWAEKGKGAFMNDQQLCVTTAELKNVLFAFSTDYSENKNFQLSGMQLYLNLLERVRNIRSTNSLFDYMMVAEGKLGGAVNLYSKIWDIAAPALIIEEAGGSMLQLNGRALNFELENENRLKNYPVITGSLPMLDELTALLTEFKSII